MNEGWRSAWCQKPLLPQIPLGWALPSMPGQGEYCSWDLSALCGLCTAWCMGLAREVTCPPLVQVRDRVPQLWSGVSQPAVLVWQPRSCEHCSEDRNWACLAGGKSACWIVFVYVCSHAHANLVLLDVEGENRLPFIKLVPAVWKSLCKGLQTSFGYLEMAKLPTYSCLSKQGWWIFFSCLPSSLTGAMGCRAICTLKKKRWFPSFYSQINICFIPDWWISERQQQCSPAFVGWHEFHGSISIWT